MNDCVSCGQVLTGRRQFFCQWCDRVSTVPTENPVELIDRAIYARMELGRPLRRIEVSPDVLAGLLRVMVLAARGNHREMRSMRPPYHYGSPFGMLKVIARSHIPAGRVMVR